MLGHTDDIRIFEGSQPEGSYVGDLLHKKTFLQSSYLGIELFLPWEYLNRDQPCLSSYLGIELFPPWKYLNRDQPRLRQ